MPKSQTRRKAKRPTPTSTPELDQEAKARAARRDLWQRRVGWPMVAVGGILFLLGQIGSRTGMIVLPFDQHHFISQVGGFLLAIRGLTWAWK